MRSAIRANTTLKEAGWEVSLGSLDAGLFIGSLKYDWIDKNKADQANNLFFINIAAIGKDWAIMPEVSNLGLAGICLYLLKVSH